MISYLRHGLFARPGPVLASLAAITVGAVAFVLLTAQVVVQQLELRGQVSQTTRGSYDILVRTSSGRTSVEASQNLVRPNAITDQFGGIRLDQVDQIRAIDGVQVAAPVAMIGYVLQTAEIPIDITDHVSAGQRALFVADGLRSTDQGLSRFEQPGLSYTYETPDRLSETAPPANGGPYGVIDRGDDNRLVCPAQSRPAAGPFTIANQGGGVCWSTTNGVSGAGWSSLPRGHVGIVLHWTFPFLLAAVDPAAESALVGLDHAVGQGTYLAQSSSTVGSVPVLLASHTAINEEESVAISRLPSSAADRFAQGLTGGQIAALTGANQGRVVQTARVTAEQAYQALIQEYLQGSQQALVDNFWTTGPTDYTRSPDGQLQPITVENTDQVWRSDVRSQGFVAAPPESSGTQFRRIQPHPAIAEGLQSDQSLPMLHTVGTFDAAKLITAGPGQSGLGVYGSQAPTAADAGTAALLGNQPLLPSGDIGGYLQSTPTMLTSLDQLSRFTDSSIFHGVSAAAPISAVRVRVSGVTGLSAVSRERVRAVADEIHRRTGLDVAVTLGDTGVIENVELPAAGTRPALLLHEAWRREGVVATLERTTDRKSELLAVLVLAVCVLFIFNAAAATVRVRRPELSLLSCLGWSRRQLFRMLLLELGGLSSAAGLIGIAVILLVHRALGVPVSFVRALTILPVALIVTVLGALPIAWRAVTPPPLFTLPGGGDSARPGRPVRSVTGLALGNLLRRPGRSLVGLVAVAISTAAATLLLSISLTFHGNLIGAVLGSATTLHARRVDYLSAGLAVLLAASAVADATYFNVRDRRSELAVLAAVGWADRTVTRLVLTESVATAVLGALPGALLGTLAAATFGSSFSSQILVISLCSALAMAGVVAGAAWLPLRLLRRWPSSTLMRDS